MPQLQTNTAKRRPSFNGVFLMRRALLPLLLLLPIGAQASGVITLASDTGGIPECVDDGRSAFLIPPRNPQALADKMEWLLDHPSSWEALQRSGRAWVESRYAMHIIGRRLWETYREVVTKHLRT